MNPFAHPVIALRELTRTLITYGPPGLLLLSFLDSAGVPMVGGVDALLIAVSTQAPNKAYLAATFAIIGSLLGSTFLFVIARKGGEVFLHRHISSGFGKRLHLWFQRYGLVTVFIPALSPIPMPMKIPIFCAGALQVRYEYFLLVLLSARVIRYFGLAWLAVRYGAAAIDYVRANAWQIGAAALIIAIGVMLMLRLLQKKETSVGIPQ